MAGVVDASGTAQVEDAVERDMLALASELLNETPKIEAAVKNLLAVKLSEQRVNKLEQKIHVIGDSGEVEVRQTLDDLDPVVLQRLCGSILRAVNAVEMATPLEWAAAHPQGEEELAAHRMDEIKRYKVVHMLWNRTRGNGQKATKAFGRSVLGIWWHQVRDAVLAASAPLASAKLVGQLLDTLDPTCTTNEPSSSLSQRRLRDSDLVWALDFAGALRARSEQRFAEAQERFAQHAADSAEQEREGPTIEQVEEDEAEGASGASAVEGAF